MNDKVGNVEKQHVEVCMFPALHYSMFIFIVYF